MPLRRPYFWADQLTQDSVSVKASPDLASSLYVHTDSIVSLFGPPGAVKACMASDVRPCSTHIEGKTTLATSTFPSVPFERKGTVDTFLLERRLRQSSMSPGHVPRAKLESKHDDDKLSSRAIPHAGSAINPESYARTLTGLQFVTNLENDHRFACTSAQRHKLESAYE
jgi:hypothetical protein